MADGKRIEGALPYEDIVKFIEVIFFVKWLDFYLCTGVKFGSGVWFIRISRSSRFTIYRQHIQ